MSLPNRAHPATGLWAHPCQSRSPGLVLLAAALALPYAGISLAQADPERIERRVVMERFGGLPCSEAEDLPGMKRVSRPYLGVEPTRLTPELRRHFGVPEDLGVMLGQVEEGSAAAAAGLEVGDIVTRVDGREIHGPWDLSNAIRERLGGEAIDVEYWREGRTYETGATLGEKEGCVYDVSYHMDHLVDLDLHLEKLRDLPGLEISQEALDQALEALKEVDWEEQLERQLEVLEEIEIEELDLRMEELQEEMRDLRVRIHLESERLGGKVSRQLREQMRALEDRERVRAEAREQRHREIRERERARVEERLAVAEKYRAEAEARSAEREAQRQLREELARAKEEAEAAEEAEKEGGGLMM
ncbi:MAG: PDZ domain-containing protein [Holophagales bacterium]|nr:PDZ domain-containing protein [Holophagales bacterium]